MPPLLAFRRRLLQATTDRIALFIIIMFPIVGSVSLFVTGLTAGIYPQSHQQFVYVTDGLPNPSLEECYF